MTLPDNTEERLALVVAATLIALVALAFAWKRGAARASFDEPAPLPTVDAGAGEVPAAPAAEKASARCVALEEANRDVLEGARMEDDDCDSRLWAVESDTSFCAETAVGLWSTRVVRVVWQSPDSAAREGSPCPDLGVEVALVHIDRDGHEASAVPGLAEAWRADAGDVMVNVSNVAGWGSRSLASISAFDFDGDGDLEVFVASTSSEEGGDRATREIYSYVRGAVTPYPPASGFDLEKLEDVDGDGRPDLVGRGPYAKVLAHDDDVSTHPVAPLVFVAHSQKGGTFSALDAAARAFTKRECPVSPTLHFAADQWLTDADARQIVCARAWGQAQDVVEHALDERCKQYEQVPAELDSCPRWAKELAAIAPPLSLGGAQ